MIEMIPLGEIGPFKVVLYPVKDAKIAGTNIRVVGREEGLNGLVKNIDKIGLLHFVWMTSKGEIYAGGRRWLSFLRGEREGSEMFNVYKIEGKMYIPAIVYDCSEEMQSIISLSEGLHKSELRKDDTAFCGKYLIDKKGMTLEEVARFLGIKKETLALYFIHQELPDDIKKVIPVNETSVRRDRTIRALTNVAGIKENKELRQKAAIAGYNLPIDVADSYRIQLKLGLPVWDEIEDIKNNPRKYETLQIKVPKEFMGRFYGHLAEKKQYTFTQIFVLAIEAFMKDNS